MKFVVPPFLKEHGCITKSQNTELVSSRYTVLKDKLKQCVFSLLMKAAVSWITHRSAGKEFQAAGPVWENVRVNFLELKLHKRLYEHYAENCREYRPYKVWKMEQTWVNRSEVKDIRLHKT